MKSLFKSTKNNNKERAEKIGDKEHNSTPKFANQVFFTFLSLYLTSSVITIDFLFLEKISYLATIGISSLLAYIYLIQSITTAFAQAMVNNAIYQDPSKGEFFNKTLSAGFLYVLILVVILSIILFFSRGFLLSFLSISIESKQYAMDYITYIIPFLLIYAISQYYVYIIYALNSAFANIVYVALILGLNFSINYLFYRLNFGVQGVALANGLAVLILMPLYVFFCSKNRIKLSFFNLQGFYSKAYIGVKKLGFASILEQSSHNFIQFIIVIILAKLGAEMLSAKYHTQNFVLFITTMSLALGLTLQMNVARMYGSGNILAMQKLYSSFLKYAIIISIFLNIILFIVLYLNIDYISENALVKKYILIALLMTFMVEPIRALSILAKAYLKGLQSANLPMIFNIAGKFIITLPLCFLVLNYSTLGLVGVLGVEAITYLVNFISFQAIIIYILKKNKQGKDFNNALIIK